MASPKSGIPMNHAPDWYEAARIELADHFSEKEKSENERKIICMSTIDRFHGLFLELAKELKIRDEWGEQFCYIVPFGTGTIERSKKMGTQFTFAITMDGWLIEAGLRHSDHIRHMTDEFWNQIVSLAKIGKASLVGGKIADSTPAIKRLNQHKNSLVFSLVRDYMFLMQAPRDGLSSASVGHIEILLPLESDEKSVREYYRAGLDALYQANYLLYRSAYQEFRRVLKKHGVTKPQLSAQMSAFGES
jgi:hypothetical protein